MTTEERPHALLLRGGRILDPSQGLDVVGDVLVQEGRVRRAARGAWRGELPSGCQVIDVRGLVVAPGFVDLHCHLREPGYEAKETIATGTRAAAWGGFTTVCCMPNTDPPLDTAAAVAFVLERARQQGVVRVLPIGCVTRGRSGVQLADMADLAKAGVVAFSDDGDPVADAHLMRQAFSYSRLTGLPIINHCQDKAITREGVVNEGWVASRLGLRGAPAAAEEVMVARDIALAALTGGRLHLAHVSTAGSVELLRRAKARGLPVTAEVTPHHLMFTDEWVLGYRDEGLRAPAAFPYDTTTKVNPPLRAQGDVQALRRALKEGVVDAIATDHAPHTLLDKLCTYDEAAFGISGLETALGLLMGLVQQEALDLPTLINRLTAAPAAILGLPLGTLKEGSPADVVVIDPDREWVVDVAAFASKGRNTPLAGATLKGKVVATLFGGAFVHNELAMTSGH
ncbi:MAG: dihydroorotase [Dehalococcoidia bacterium]|nr:dihydroorotase [Dehalococcoidia bacterium]